MASDLSQQLLEEIRASRAQHSAEIAALRDDLHQTKVELSTDTSALRNDFHQHQVEQSATLASTIVRIVSIEDGMGRHRDDHKTNDPILHKLRGQAPNGAKAIATLLAAIAALVAALASLWTSLR